MHSKEELYYLVCDIVKKRLDKQEKDQKMGQGLFDKTDFNTND